MKYKKMIYRGRETVCGFCDFCGLWKPFIELETLLVDGVKKHRCIKCTCEADPSFGRLKVNALGFISKP